MEGKLVPTVSFAVPNFTLTSSFYGYRDTISGTVVEWYSTPTKPSVTKEFSLSSLPVGATIHSATASFTAGGSAYGGTTWQEGSTSKNLAVTVSGGSNKSITYEFRSNTGGSYSEAGSYHAGTMTFSNVQITVDYTEPFSKCSAPSAVSLNYTSRIPGETSILSWSGAGAGTNNPITGFQIYRATAVSGPYTSLGSKINHPSSAGSTSVTASSTNGETYYFKVLTFGTVSSFDSELSSVWASLKAEVSACSPPSAISRNGTDVAPGASKTLSWSGAAAGANNPILKYEVHRASSAGGTYSYLGETAGTSLAVTSPTGNNSSFFYKIKTLGTVSGYHSGLSSSYGVLTTTVTAPTPPTAVSVASGSDAAPGKTRTLSWTGAAAGSNDTIWGYHVFGSFNGGTYTFLAEVLTTGTGGSLVVTSALSSGTTTYKIKTLGNSFSLESGLSANYGSLTTITVKSTGKLDKTQVPADGASQITLTITPQLDTSYTHKVTWYIEPTNYTSGVRSLVAADYSDVMIIPAGWLAGIAQLSAIGTCVVETFNGSASLGSNTYTFTVTVPPASSFVLDKTTVEASGSATIRATVTAGHSSYSHEVLWQANDTYKSTNTIAAGVSYHQLTLPITWCNATPNSTTFSASCTVKTFKSSGSVLVGMDSKTFNFTVPASVVPAVSSFTAAQLEAYWGLYVKTKSRCRLTLNAAGAYGSQVNSFRVVGAAQDSLSQAYSTGVQWTSGYLQLFGSQTFTVTVTDSRGRSAQGTVSISVTDYALPSITSASYARATSSGVASNTGTYITAKATFTYSAIGSNAITAKAYYRQQGSSTWLPSGGTAITNNTAVTHGGASIALSYSYETKIDLTDAFATVTNLGSVPVATKVFDMRETRASFGRYATNDKELAIPADWDFVRGSTRASYEGHTHSYAPLTGTGASGTWPIAISGNAATATSAAAWTTARNLTIGSTAKSVNGSANVAWTLAEIGAAASAHSHTKANISDFPASMPASDVYTWAKAAAKPAYTSAEVGAAPASHTHSYAPLTGGGTSGSWPISITGSSASCTGNAATATNSTKLGGLALGAWAQGTQPPANQVLRTDASGYVNVGWLNTVSGTASGAPTRIYCSQDAYLRYYPPGDATLRRSMGVYITSGTANPSGGSSGDMYIQYI